MTPPPPRKRKPGLPSLVSAPYHRPGARPGPGGPLQTLNTSQRAAAEAFVGLDEGLQLLQGPPGTGKTTTVVALLLCLAAAGTRTMVACPPAPRRSCLEPCVAWGRVGGGGGQGEGETSLPHRPLLRGSRAMRAREARMR